MHADSGIPLRFDLTFPDLYARDGLARLDDAFLAELLECAPGLHAGLMAARRDPTCLAPKAASELIVELAPHVEDFVGRLFGIEAELKALQARHDALAPLRSVKRKFVQRRLAGKTVEHAKAIDAAKVAAELEAFLLGPITDASFAEHVERWLEDEPGHAEQLKLAADYAVWAVLTPEGKAKHPSNVVFGVPHKIDVLHLVPHASDAELIVCTGLFDDETEVPEDYDGQIAEWKSRKLPIARSTGRRSSSPRSAICGIATASA